MSPSTTTVQHDMAISDLKERLERIEAVVDDNSASINRAEGRSSLINTILPIMVYITGGVVSYSVYTEIQSLRTALGEMVIVSKGHDVGIETLNELSNDRRSRIADMEKDISAAAVERRAISERTIEDNKHLDRWIGALWMKVYQEPFPDMDHNPSIVPKRSYSD